MAKNGLNHKKIDKLVDKINETYVGDKGVNFIDATNLPVRDKILDILENLLELVFPGYTGRREVFKSNVKYMVGDLVCQVYSDMCEQLERAFHYGCRMDKCEDCDCQRKAEEVATKVIEKIPELREVLKSDVEAAYDGDPAARSYEEIVISYPCMVAIPTYRIAHEFYLENVPLIPRLMSEWAHCKTGIDIHPGATIGKSFFIDHGTGVVIGETCVIGEHVKIYQGTTLGALSFRKDERGRIIKGGKRHPTIEDNVTIYAEATILGDITIGKGAVIGGNVWLKDSVPEGTVVTISNPDLVYRKPKDKK